MKIAGILFRNRDKSSLEKSVLAFSSLLRELKLEQYVEFHSLSSTDLGFEQRVTLKAESAKKLAPGFNTMEIVQNLQLDPPLKKRTLLKKFFLLY